VYVAAWEHCIAPFVQIREASLQSRNICERFGSATHSEATQISIEDECQSLVTKGFSWRLPRALCVRSANRMEGPDFDDDRLPSPGWAVWNGGEVFLWVRLSAVKVHSNQKGSGAVVRPQVSETQFLEEHPCHWPVSPRYAHILWIDVAPQSRNTWNWRESVIKSHDIFITLSNFQKCLNWECCDNEL
jgi:hypothetical protein